MEEASTRRRTFKNSAYLFGQREGILNLAHVRQQVALVVAQNLNLLVLAARRNHGSLLARACRGLPVAKALWAERVVALVRVVNLRHGGGLAGSSSGERARAGAERKRIGGG